MQKFTEVYTKARDVVSNQVFAEEWQTFLTDKCQIKSLLSDIGFSTTRTEALELIRAKIKEASKKAKGVGKAIYAAADNSSSSGTLEDRAATLKMLRHVYRIVEKGSQDVWVYSPPKAHAGWIFDEIQGEASTVKSKLGKETEIFSKKEMKWMSSALAVALKITEDARAKLGSDDNQAAKDMVKRWFLDEDCGDTQLNEAITKLKEGLQKIAVACNSSTLVFTDYADWREKRKKYFGAAFRGGEGGGFPVIYLEGAFTRLTGNSGKEWLCAETIIHEFSHHEIKTRDHRYDSAGLKPTKDSFPYAKAIDNADSWGYFALDLAGYLSKADFKKTWK